MSKQTVFISGATGFIAQHIIKQLLDTNQYRVIGSARKGAKADKLKADFNSKDLSIVFVDEIAKPNAFDEAFKEHGSELDYVLHTASPISMSFTDYENQVIIPAINGTKGIFEATVKYAPNVKAFVLTSSTVAIHSPAQTSNKDFVASEKTWNDLTLANSVGHPMLAYCYAKTAAEKAAWELHEKLHAKFTLTAINPGFVFGPQCFDSSVTEHLNASCEMINAQIHSKLGDPINDQLKGSFIDVRDVARAHIDSLTNKKLAGKRLVLVHEKFALQAVADILNEKFPELRGKIAVGEPGTSHKILAASPVNIDNSVTKDLLGFKLRTLEESVVDTASQILKVESQVKA